MGDEYTPLAPVEDYPLHPEGIYPPNFYWACTAPERPQSSKTMYDWRCHKCVLMAQVHIEIHGDKGMVSWKRDGVTRAEDVLLSWLVDRSLYWFEQEGESSGR